MSHHLSRALSTTTGCPFLLRRGETRGANGQWELFRRDRSMSALYQLGKERTVMWNGKQCSDIAGSYQVYLGLYRTASRWVSSATLAMREGCIVSVVGDSGVKRSGMLFSKCFILPAAKQQKAGYESTRRVCTVSRGASLSWASRKERKTLEQACPIPIPSITTSSNATTNVPTISISSGSLELACFLAGGQ